MEPESLLRQPPPPARPQTDRSETLDETLRTALAQFASHVADDREAVETVCSVVQPLLHAYGAPIPVEQWRDWSSLATRRHLIPGGQQERGLLIIDGMSHILSEPRTPHEEQRWLLDAEARRHQVYLARDAGLLLLAWRPAPMLRGWRIALDHWRAGVRPMSPEELLANYPVQAFLHGLQEALTLRVERSRQWAEFIQRLNEEFEKLLA